MPTGRNKFTRGRESECKRATRSRVMPKNGFEERLLLVGDADETVRHAAETAAGNDHDPKDHGGGGRDGGGEWE